MKKLQIVTVVLQVRTNFGLFKDVEDDEIIFSETSIEDNPYFLPLQLLVLSDDEIQPGDRCISKYFEQVYFIDDIITATFANLTECSKIIASYPNIQGTLPLSKETIQEWIDNGTPKECSVEMIEYEPVKRFIFYNR